MYECSVDRDLGDNLIGMALTIGILASFLPQMATLIWMKSVRGLSVMSWTINYLSNMCTFVNVSTLQWDNYVCCIHLDSFSCLQILLPQIQLAVPWICTFIVFTLYLIYSGNSYNHDLSAHNSFFSAVPLPPSSTESPAMPTWSVYTILDFLFASRGHKYVAELFILSFVITAASFGGALLVIYYAPSGVVATFAYAYGIIAAVALFIQGLPQIYTTYKTKEAGSLSVATLALQAPGALVVVYFQGFVNPNGNWTTWLPYMVTSCQQSVLIGQCTYYWFKRRASIKGTPVTRETTPLLQGDDQHDQVIY